MVGLCTTCLQPSGTTNKLLKRSIRPQGAWSGMWETLVPSFLWTSASQDTRPRSHHGSKISWSCPRVSKIASIESKSSSRVWSHWSLNVVSSNRTMSQRLLYRQISRQQAPLPGKISPHNKKWTNRKIMQMIVLRQILGRIKPKPTTKRSKIN